MRGISSIRRTSYKKTPPVLAHQGRLIGQLSLTGKTALLFYNKTGSAKVGQTKTEAGVRTVPLLPDLVGVLKRPADAMDTDYVFHGGDPSKPIPLSTYERRWKRYCSEMGFVEEDTEVWKDADGVIRTRIKHKPTLTAHVLRHGYATALFEAGVDVYTAQKLLGHANIEVTMAVYTHLRKEKETESLKKLQNFFA